MFGMLQSFLQDGDYFACWIYYQSLFGVVLYRNGHRPKKSQFGFQARQLPNQTPKPAPALPQAQLRHHPEVPQACCFQETSSIAWKIVQIHGGTLMSVLGGTDPLQKQQTRKLKPEQDSGFGSCREGKAHKLEPAKVWGKIWVGFMSVPIPSILYFIKYIFKGID